MRTLALDISTKCGYAVIENGVIGKSGVEVFDFSKIKTASERRGNTISDFDRWLHQFAVNGMIDCIVIEKPFFRGSGSRLLMPLVGIAEMIAWRCRIPCLEVPNSTIKKWLTGNGKATKDMMIKAVQDKGYNPIDDNHADAIALALYFEKHAEEVK